MAYKTIKERLENSVDLYTKLKMGGFEVSKMGKFSGVINHWVKTGEEFKGQINLIKYNKVLLLHLHNNSGKHINSMIKHVHKK